MRNVCVLLIITVFLLGVAVDSRAALFLNTVMYSDSKKPCMEQDFLELNGVGSPFVYSLTYTVTFSKPVTLTTAQLVLSHHGNSNTKNGEQWFLYGNSNYLIGQLTESNGPGLIDQVFELPCSIFYQATGNSWSVTLELREMTSGADKLEISKGVLSGTYTAAPLPPALLLFGSGLSGLLYIRRLFIV